MSNCIHPMLAVTTATLSNSVDLCPRHGHQISKANVRPCSTTSIFTLKFRELITKNSAALGCANQANPPANACQLPEICTAECNSVYKSSKIPVDFHSIALFSVILHTSSVFQLIFCRFQTFSNDYSIKRSL